MQDTTPVKVEAPGQVIFEGVEFRPHRDNSNLIRFLGKIGKYVWVRKTSLGSLLAFDQETELICTLYPTAIPESIEIPATDEAGDVVTICVPVTALDRWWSALDSDEKAEIFSSHMSYLDALEAPAETAVRG